MIIEREAFIDVFYMEIKNFHKGVEIRKFKRAPCLMSNLTSVNLVFKEIKSTLFQISEI